jgi:hypothetical protein
MIDYLLPLCVLYLGVAMCIRHGGTNALVVWVCTLPMIALAVLRGMCGTDTSAYYEAFMDLGEGGSYGGEPLFNGYARLLWWICPDAGFVVNAISLTTALLLVSCIARNRYGAWFGGLLLMPAMFYELTMNVMRFGLAAAIFLVATRIPFERRPWRYVIFAMIGTCTHFSSILLFVFFVAATQKGKTLFVMAAGVVALGLALAMPAYVGDKMNLYGGMAAPGAASGLLLLALEALLLATAIVFRRQFDIPVVGWIVFGVLTLAFYAITQITYAGIRFQLLLGVLMIVTLWRRFVPVDGRVGARLTVWLLVIGLLGLAGRIHNMSDEAGNGASPFLPYRAAPVLEEMQ